MNLICLIIFSVVLVAGLSGCREGADSRPPAAVGAPAPRVAAAGKAGNSCLECHGPFSELIRSSTNYVAPSGEKTSPHRYVPHDSKLEKDIPDCSRCHTAHSVSDLPAKGSIDLSKVSVEWCYTCHHEKNFQSCKDCHP